jgi:hypothetical protein
MDQRKVTVPDTMNFMFGTNVMSSPDLDRDQSSQSEDESYYYEMEEIDEGRENSFDLSISPGLRRN